MVSRTWGRVWVGFTVSLLVGELAYGSASVADEHVKIGVLLGSLISAIAGGTILSIRSHRSRPQETTSHY